MIIVFRHLQRALRTRHRTHHFIIAQIFLLRPESEHFILVRTGEAVMLFGSTL
jgi:hypothetical protein